MIFVTHFRRSIIASIVYSWFRVKNGCSSGHTSFLAVYRFGLRLANLDRVSHSKINVNFNSRQTIDKCSVREHLDYQMTDQMAPINISTRTGIVDIV
ncbi:hypothetical protein RvY_02191, partial [Ramazzottius varieornatus]